MGLLMVLLFVLGNACSGDSTGPGQSGHRGDEPAFYVDINDPAASDTNPGTEAAPWRTLRHAVETLTAGQTVYVKNGTYNESEGCKWTTPALNPANSGREGSPIAIRAYPGHRPLVTNDVVGKPCPVLGARDRSHIVIDGFEVYVQGHKATVIFNSHHVTLENSEIHGPYQDNSDNTDGVRVEDSDSITLSNLHIHRVHNAGKSINAAGVKLYNSSRVRIEHSEIYDTGAGIRDKCGGTDNVFAYNWIHDNQDGIIMSSACGGTSRGDVAHHNVTARNGNTGILVAGSSDSQNHDAVVYSNTSVDDHRSIFVETDIGGQASVYNNILANGSHDVTSSTSVIKDCDHNLFFNTSVGCGPSGDPLFVGGNGPAAYKLQSGSAAVGAGRNGENVGAFQTGDEVIGRRGS